MTKTQTFTKLSPAEATAEAAAALAAGGLDGLTVSSSPQIVGRQRKVFLATVVSSIPERSEAAVLAILTDLPGVSNAGTIGRSTAYIYRRMI
jgi:hypothetical protein